MTGPNAHVDAAVTPSSAEGSWRRRRYLIDARYQLRGGILVGTMTLVLLFLLNASLITRDRRDSAAGPAAEAPRAVPRTDGVSWALLLVGSAVFIGGVLAVGVVESHRTAGAAFAIRRAVEQIREGQRGVRVRLRRGDHLQELARSINTLSESLDAERDGRV